MLVGHDLVDAPLMALGMGKFRIQPTISSASISPVTAAPRAIMLVSLCSRVSLADMGLSSSAQRMPLTLLAVMDTPMPVVQQTMPRSHSPLATACAAGPAKSG